MPQSIWPVWLLSGRRLQISGIRNSVQPGNGRKILHLVRILLLHRPTFQLFSWHTCLLGILSCLVMMFVINPVYSSGSIVLLLLLLLFLHYRSPTSSWGYISQALIFHQVRCRNAVANIRRAVFVSGTVVSSGRRCGSICSCWM